MGSSSVDRARSVPGAVEPQAAVPAPRHAPRTAVSVADLARHLADGRLEAHFQPVVSLPSRHVLGFEALARIRAGGRTVPPSDFIPVAEAAGMIVDLGARMLDMALGEAARWRAGTTALSTATVAVNVAPAQLEDPGFADTVRRALTHHGVPAPVLTLEITETTAASEAARPVLDRLAGWGVRLALDDFGMGFANLDQVRRLPVQIVKLDRSFVSGVMSRGAERSIVRIVLELADALGLTVIAEGVETAAQEESLHRLGCRAAQGFLFAQPHASPEHAAASVLRGARTELLTGTPTPTPDHSAPDHPATDRAASSAEETVLAAATLLAGTDDRRRAALVAVTSDLGRRLGLPEAQTAAAARDAMLHDIDRLALDGMPPTTPGGPVPSGLREIADAVVRDAEAHDGQIGPDAVAAALREAAGSTDDPSWAVALAAMAGDPPRVGDFADLLDDLQVRRLGRRDTEDRLRSLVGVSRVLANTRDTRELLRVALEESRRIAGAASASLERWDRESGLIRTMINVGDLGPGEEMFPVDETYPIDAYDGAMRSLVEGLPVIATRDDADAMPGEVELLVRLHKGSLAAIPLFLEDRIWGQLWFSTAPQHPPFRHADIELLTSIATLMSGVVAQAENLDRVSRLAFEDPLTRVANRRAVDDELAALSQAAAPVCVVLVDVDGLKAVNDVHGHQRGDEVICGVADALGAAVAGAPGALVGRLGGDEFCVVLPGLGAEEAQAVIERAKRVGRGVGGASFCAGIAVGSGDWSPRQLLHGADIDLYRAKAARPTRLPRD